jgi:hypothetical protein
MDFVRMESINSSSRLDLERGSTILTRPKTGAEKKEQMEIDVSRMENRINFIEELLVVSETENSSPFDAKYTETE